MRPFATRWRRAVARLFAPVFAPFAIVSWLVLWELGDDADAVLIAAVGLLMTNLIDLAGLAR